MADLDAAALDAAASDTAAVEVAIAQAKKDLLGGPPYHGLITRDYLRAERMLEYTRRAVHGVDSAEVGARIAIRCEERSCVAHFDFYAARLLFLCWEGTDGTPVQAEAEERVARDGIVAGASASRSTLAAAEEERCAEALHDEGRRTRREALEIEDVSRTESALRFSVTIDRTVFLQSSQHQFIVQGGQVFDVLLWRIVQDEYHGRITAECDERNEATPIADSLWAERQGIRATGEERRQGGAVRDIAVAATQPVVWPLPAGPETWPETDANADAESNGSPIGGKTLIGPPSDASTEDPCVGVESGGSGGELELSLGDERQQNTPSSCRVVCSTGRSGGKSSSDSHDRDPAGDSDGSDSLWTGGDDAVDAAWDTLGLEIQAAARV